MITFKKFGETFKIRNDDWKKMKKRFDLDVASWSRLDGEYEIRVDCPLCERYNCDTCPLRGFATENEVSCIVFLSKIFKPMYFGTAEERLCWRRFANKKARKQLDKMRRMMDKIEASQ